MKRLLVLIMLVIASAFAVPATAQRAMSVDLVSEIADPAPGSTTRIALRMSPRAGWHGYWRNPGQAGRPVVIEWSAPQGVSFGEIAWPAPSRLEVAGLVNYVMPGDYDLVMPMTLPRGIAVGASLPIRASLTWFVCSDGQCSMEKGEVSLSLRVGDGSTPGAGADAIRGAQLSLPRALYGVKSQVSASATSIRLPIRSGVDASKLRVFLEDRAVPVDAVQSSRRDGSAVVVDVATARGVAGTLRGVATDGVHSWSFSTSPVPVEGEAVPSSQVVATAPVAAPSTAAVSSSSAPVASSTPASASAAPSMRAASPMPVAAARAASHPSPVPSMAARTELPGPDAVMLAGVIASALLGGLLLNLMPCVFPILSIKAMSLVRFGESERAARLDAIAYCAGCVATCAGLGVAIVAMRAAGVAAGWSFQLQDPRMVAALLALTVALALNLAGLFEMRLPAGRGGVGASSFGAGAASAFVATPCSGPFMGAALGAAMTLPALAAVAVFAALGLGMSLPFLVLGFVPKARGLLPRPGAWMATFRRVLAVPAALTAAWLAWVLWGQSGPVGLLGMAAACVVVALCLWSVGAGQRGGRDLSWLRALPAAAVVAFVMAVMPVSVGGVSQALASDGSRVRFDEGELERLRSEGRTVFVDFTARWCLTCKVNEGGVLGSDATADMFRRAGVVVMVADWTDGDPAITRFLAGHGRNSIPFYLVYRGGAERPIVLPQILTPAAISTAVGA